MFLSSTKLVSPSLKSEVNRAQNTSVGNKVVSFGSNSYVTKDVRFSELVKVLK